MAFVKFEISKPSDKSLLANIEIICSNEIPEQLAVNLLFEYFGVDAVELQVQRYREHYHIICLVDNDGRLGALEIRLTALNARHSGFINPN